MTLDSLADYIAALGKAGELMDFVVQRVLDHLDLDIPVGPRWQGDGDG